MLGLSLASVEDDVWLITAGMEYVVMLKHDQFEVLHYHGAIMAKIV